jgi:hypothetical protein
MGKFGPSFSAEQTSVMDLAFEIACKELELDPSDDENRDRIVQAILKLARCGDFDLDHLLNYAISRFAYRR